MKKTHKEKDPLRLVNWANDGCPPLDLNTAAHDVLKLVKEVIYLRNKLKHYL